MFWLQVLITLLCLTLIVAFSFSLLLQNFTSVPFVPSPGKKLKQVFRKLNINQHTKLIDVGSGTGTALFAAASLGATVTGVEINPFLSIFTKIRKLVNSSRNRITVLNQSFYKVDLSQYDTVYAYLLPEILQKLSDKLYTELQPGSKIISNTFQIPGKQPAQVIEDKFYVYIVQ